MIQMRGLRGYEVRHIDTEWVPLCERCGVDRFDPARPLRLLLNLRTEGGWMVLCIPCWRQFGSTYVSSGTQPPLQDDHAGVVEVEGA